MLLSPWEKDGLDGICTEFSVVILLSQLLLLCVTYVSSLFFCCRICKRFFLLVGLPILSKSSLWLDLIFKLEG